VKNIGRVKWTATEGQMENLIELGQTGIYISPLGLGTGQWGNRIVWGYGRTHTDGDIHEAFLASLEGGVRFFDTAEMYGRGRSEILLGENLRDAKGLFGDTSAVVASKFMPWPWRVRKATLRSALEASLARLGLERIDLYQIHWPTPPLPVTAWAEALADVMDAGLARAVGVSNYDISRMLRAHDILQRRGGSLTSNQVEYSLLNRRAERNGLLEKCKELGITLLAYSPLARGLLTGKYTPENPPPGIRRHREGRSKLVRMQPLIHRMRELGEAHQGKSASQVALNWIMCKGAVPIPGAKNARQAQDNAAAVGWRLEQGEVEELDQLSSDI
jgi:aryl-alcohol dehydrogenase-like predicted oxidoreductase